MAVMALLVGGGLYGAVQLWAWYHFQAGESALAQFETQSARVHFQQCLRVWPRSAAAHLLASRADRRAGDFAAAEQHLDECRKLADADVDEAAAFEWALLRATTGNLATVEESLQSRILSRPGDAPLIWEALAEGYRRNYRMPEALRCLDTWLHFEPDNTHAIFLRGELHRQVGAVNRARDEYRRVIELDPAHREAQRHLARCLVQVGRYQEAAEHLDRLLRESPSDLDLMTLKARSQYDQGQRQEAIALLDEALRTQPDYGPALQERGRAALAAGQFTDAEKWFRQAVRALPYNYESNWGLYQALQGQQKTEEAKAHLGKAQQLKNAYERIHEIQTHEMTLRPADASLQTELGEVLLQTGQAEAGGYWLLSALQINPELPAAHAALARLYDEQGNTAAAQQHRQDAERLGMAKKD
jgi:tetratricopeptide (TPR) repeat protein